MITGRSTVIRLEQFTRSHLRYIVQIDLCACSWHTGWLSAHVENLVIGAWGAPDASAFWRAPHVWSRENLHAPLYRLDVPPLSRSLPPVLFCLTKFEFWDFQTDIPILCIIFFLSLKIFCNTNFLQRASGNTPERKQVCKKQLFRLSILKDFFPFWQKFRKIFENKRFCLLLPKNPLVLQHAGVVLPQAWGRLPQVGWLWLWHVLSGASGPAPLGSLRNAW